MRRAASFSSLLTLLSAGALAACGDTSQSSSGNTGGSAGSTTTMTGGSAGTAGSAATAGSAGTTTGSGGSGGMTAGSGGMTAGSGGSGGSGGGMMACVPMLPPPMVDCNVPDFNPPQDPNETCEVTTPGASGLVLRGTLLLPDQVMHKGEVLINESGTIVCTGCDCSASPGYDMATVVTCANGVISPGLINPHDHITFSQNKPIGANTTPANGGHGTERYEHRNQWRKGQDGHTQLSAPGGASTVDVLLAELRFVMSGATTAASAGGKPGLMRNVDVSGMGEGITVKVDSDTFPLDDSSGVVDGDASDGCQFGAAPTTAGQIATDTAYLPHISEGIDADSHTEFLCTSTAPPPSGSNDIIQPKTAIIHSIALTATDVSKVRVDSAKVIWSPRSNVDLYGNTAQVTLLDALGVPIALGTDWLPTGSMNMLRELKCADDLNKNYYAGHFSDKQLWQMVTTNAAMAVGVDSTLGMLRPGYIADIAIYNGATDKDYRAVIGAEMKDVVLVMRGGQVLYGDSIIVDDLRMGCEPLDVCTSPKRACVAVDPGAGTTLATLMAEAQATYAMFFCPSAVNPNGTPDNEPSCVPYRAAEYPDGIVQGMDDDGDGVANATDNCPAVFNPRRPMDTKQPDDDGDGKGDACDPCPFDGLDACKGIDANDVDGDCVANGEDNCPYRANGDQLDADADGHGDICDPCDSAPNPGLLQCPPGSIDPIPIKAIRDPNDPQHPAQGDTVAITNAYVTAIRPKTGGSQGFYVQDDPMMPYSGIFVFTGNMSPTVQVGNKVSVSGIYSEFFQLSELSNVAVTIDDAGTMLPFAPIDIADPASIATGGVMAEGYESMLVKVGAVSVVTLNADAPSDFDEFAVTGSLRIDDQIFDNVKNMGLDNTCAVGKGFKSITGIGAFSFANYKLEPRAAADFELLDAADANYCKPFP